MKKTFNRFKFRKIENQKNQKLKRSSNPTLYIPDITEISNRIITKQNTKPLQTITQILPNLTDPIEPKQQPGVIYEIPCLHCDGIYIGEAGRAFCTRCKEHLRDVNSKNLAQFENNDMNNKSALVKHVYLQNHHMDWNNSKILAKETDYTRRFLEAFFIYSNN